MHSATLTEMVNGWFVGEFSPAAFKTGNCEVAIKHYRKGEREKAHYHKIATEITLILKGRVSMVGQVWETNDIVVLNPCEISSFEALTDTITVVVKVPGALGDKYLVE